MNEIHRNHITLAKADVYPNERWALFIVKPTVQKVTGKLDDHIIGKNHQQSLKTYIKKNTHNLCDEKLENIDLPVLEKVLCSQRIHQRANMAKLIHH